MDNEKQTKETHLEIRLSSFIESKERLTSILTRVQELELKLSGDRIADLKDNKTMCDELAETPKSSIMNDLNVLGNDFHHIINKLDESIVHLEDFI